MTPEQDDIANEIHTQRLLTMLSRQLARIRANLQAHPNSVLETVLNNLERLLASQSESLYALQELADQIEAQSESQPPQGAAS